MPREYTRLSGRAERTVCINGHPFTVSNTISKPDGSRDCRECSRARRRAYKARKRGERPAKAVRTHCASGHELTPDNIMTARPGKGRECATCNRLRAARHHARSAS